MAKPDRVDLPLSGAVGQRIVRIELRHFWQSPLIHLEDGTILNAVASGSDTIALYRMPKEVRG